MKSYALPDSDIEFYSHTKGIILSIVNQNMSTELGSLSQAKNCNFEQKIYEEQL